MPTFSCDIRLLGRKPYTEVWELQRSLQQALIQGAGTETLLICEHDPVITVGKSAKEENLLFSRDALKKKGVPVFDIERGGDVTYHGPGQVVGYPILDLNRHKRDVHWYMRTLEEVVIRSLAAFGIQGFRIEKKTGVWVKNQNPLVPFASRKIAAMGVRLSKWVTLHGFSINVKDCSAGFSLINPCGFQSAEVTWMEEELNRAVALKEIESQVVDNFLELFEQ